jgi:hypothetical protein
MVMLRDVPELALVPELLRVRGRRRIAEKRNATALNWLKAYHDVNADMVDGRAVGYETTSVYPAYRKFETDKLKRRYPAAYARCRVLKTWHQVKHTCEPEPWIADLGPQLPLVGRNIVRSDLEATGVTVAVALAAKQALQPIVRELTAEEDRLKTQLEINCEKFLLAGSWDGQPFAFQDGYTYGLRALRFDAAVAVQILNEATVSQFSVMVPEKSVVHYHLMGESAAVGADAFPFEGD